MAANVTFRLLGPLAVLADGQPVKVASRRQRVVLTMLLLEPNRTIPVDRLIEAVWDESPPATARSQLQICITRLRKALTLHGARSLIQTDHDGYLLRVDPAAVDTTSFGSLVASGRSAARSGDPATAVTELRQALDLFTGKAAANVDSRLVQVVAGRLNEERLAAHEECLAQELALGRHREITGELRELVVTYPLQEKLRVHLIVALHRSGRPAEALDAYQQARTTFADELGLDPGDELRALEQAILSNDPSLVAPASPTHKLVRAAGQPPTVPRQLPAAIGDFVDRTEMVAAMRAQLTPGGCTKGTQPHVEIVAVRGRSGVGKSALAVHVAHAVGEHYPGGQLFAHMRDNEAQPARPEHVLAQFLRALDVPPALIPESLADLATLYRTQLAQRRVLVVLDDVTSIDQVTPLLPGHPSSALLVTSRMELSALRGAHVHDLDVFSPAVSAELLTDLLGADRVRAEHDAALALAEHCGHLPLALRVVAAKLANRPHWSIGRMVSRLADEKRRLDELSDGPVGVRASISLSYVDLTESAQRLLLLLSTQGPNDFAHWVAAPLLDMDVADSDDVLDQLVASRLVETHTSTDGSVRFQLHDLVRLFAAEGLACDVSAEQLREAQSRLVRCWLSLLCAAHTREFDMGLHGDAEHWVLARDVVAQVTGSPIPWCRREYSNLVEAVRLAALVGESETCWDLAITASEFFELLGDLDAWRRTNEIALQAARGTGNFRGEAAMLYSRAGPALNEYRMDEAQRDLHQALSWFEKSADSYGRALVLCELSACDRVLGRPDLAVKRLESALPGLVSGRDRPTQAYAYNIMAKIAIEHGRLDEAESLLRLGADICAKSGASRVRAQMAYWLGEVFRRRGELDRAEVEFKYVLQIVSDAGDPIGIAHALRSIGCLRSTRRDFPGAEAALGEALETAKRSGYRQVMLLVILDLTELALERGELAAAARSLDEAEALLVDRKVTQLASTFDRLQERLQGSLAGASAAVTQ